MTSAEQRAELMEQTRWLFTTPFYWDEFVLTVLATMVLPAVTLFASLHQFANWLGW